MEHSLIVITWRKSVTPRKLKLCLGSKVPLVEKCKSWRHEQSQRKQGIKPELQRKNHPALTVIWKNLEKSYNPYPYTLIVHVMLFFIILSHKKHINFEITLF